MKQCMVAVFVAVLCYSFTGCANVQQHPAFREAGSPPERKATLLVGTELQEVRIDGYKVAPFWQNDFRVGWVVEILPGEHEVEAFFGEHKLSGTFMAQHDRCYAIVVVSHRIDYLSGSGYATYQLDQASIGVLPQGETYDLSREKRWTLCAIGEEEAMRYNKVVDLRCVSCEKQGPPGQFPLSGGSF